MNTNFDFKKYNDANDVKGYDLFIDRLGNMYKIKKTKSNSIVDHNSWAEKYMIETQKINKLNFKINSSNLINLINLKGPAEILVHSYGFVYYSHDALLFQPIIKAPNPKYFNNNVTDEQLDSLTSVMLMNNENPFVVPMIMGEEDYDYDYTTINKR